MLWIQQTPFHLHHYIPGCIISLFLLKLNTPHFFKPLFLLKLNTPHFFKPLFLLKLNTQVFIFLLTFPSPNVLLYHLASPLHLSL